MEILDTTIRIENEMKRIKIGKKKLSLFADDIILYKENPKDATKIIDSSWMNLVKFQNTKLVHRNLLDSYTLTVKYHKEKLEHNFLYHLIKSNKISRNIPT